MTMKPGNHRNDTLGNRHRTIQSITIEKRHANHSDRAMKIGVKLHAVCRFFAISFDPALLVQLSQ